MLLVRILIKCQYKLGRFGSQYGIVMLGYAIIYSVILINNDTMLYYKHGM